VSFLSKNFITRSVLSVAIIVLVALFFPWAIQRLIETETQANKFAVSNLPDVLRINSLAPQSVKVGENYTYALSYTYTGTDNVEISFENLPNWLEWYDDVNVIQGVVPEGVLSFTIKIHIKAGDQEAFQDSAVEVIR